MLIQKNLQSLKTSECGMFSLGNMKHRAVIAKRLLPKGRKNVFVRKHEAPCGNREALGLSKNVFV